MRSALAAIQEKLKPRCNDVRWIPDQQLHLTVKFLGDVPDGELDTTAAALAMAAGASQPFEMEITGCGGFPPSGSVRIVWTGVKEESGSLQRCVESVEEALESAGFPRERRPFSAHITIGRVRMDRSVGRLRSVMDACSFRPVKQEVSSLTLMSSVLSPKGPAYTPVSVARLSRINP